MEFQAAPMTMEIARNIADCWKYAPPFDFYDINADPDDYAEFINPDLWPVFFQEVREGGRLIGFFTGELESSNSSVEIGLGLSPELTGHGLGEALVKFILEWLRTEHSLTDVTLNVAAFNERAIKVYERCGFELYREYDQDTNGDTFHFVEMRRCRQGSDSIDSDLGRQQDSGGTL